MIKKTGADYVIIGHSDNRAEGDTNEDLNSKIKFSLKNKLKIIFCIGENLRENKKKLTKKILI